MAEQMHPLAAIGVRVARTYVQGVLGFLVIGGVGVPPLAAPDFLHVLINAASLAVAPAVVALLMNSIEYLTKLDETAPEIRA